MNYGGGGYFQTNGNINFYNMGEKVKNPSSLDRESELKEGATV
jgi:hypothetical protein